MQLIINNEQLIMIIGWIVKTVQQNNVICFKKK